MAQRKKKEFVPSPDLEKTLREILSKLRAEKADLFLPQGPFADPDAVAKGLTQWVAGTHQPFRLHSRADARSARPHLSGRPNSAKSLIAVPVIVDKAAIGVLNVESDVSFNEEDVRVLEGMATEVGRLLVAEDTALVASAAEQLHRADSTSVSLLKTFTLDALRKLAAEPEQLRNLNSRMFEELIAELLKRDGWDVDLTLPTRDGGYDILALRSIDDVKIQMIVEAKKYREDRPVGVAIVRELYAVKTMSHASKAMLATTSYVSYDARREFRNVIPYELELREFSDLTTWLAKHKP